MSQPISFEELIHPLTPEHFFEEYWERRPVLIEGAPDRFAHLFSSKDMGRLLHYLRPPTPEGLLVVKGGSPAQTRWTNVDGSPQLKKVREAWRNGHTILINRLENLWEPVARLKAALQERLHHPIDTDLYLTPPDSQGFAFHFDVMDVFVIQVEGSKLWQVREPASYLPLPGEHYDVPQDKLPPLVFEAELRAGSVLYMPRGYVHAGRTTGQTSLHVSVGVNVITWVDFVAAAVSTARADKQFRKALPPAFLHAGADLQEPLQNLLQQLPGLLRLDDALGKLAEQLIVSKQPPPDEDFFTAEVELTPDSRLRRRGGVICRTAHGRGYAVLQYSGGRITGPEKIAPALDYVERNRAFAVRALPGDLNDREKVVLARRLVNEGLLERDASDEQP